MSRNDSQRLRRLLRLILSLSRAQDGISVYELARQEGLDDKTIRRDLMLLRNTGLPLVEDRRKFGKKLWRIRSESHRVEFNLFELLSLYMARRLMEPFAGTPFFEGIHSAFRRIEAEVFPDSVELQTQLSSLLYFSTAGSSDYTQRTHLISTVLQSISQRQALRMLYRKAAAEQARSYVICPYSLAAYHGSLYIVARSVKVAAIRHFKMDRVQTLELLDQRYRIPRTFDVEAWFEGTFGVFGPGKKSYRIEIEFQPEVSETVKESRWHRSQTFRDQADGGTVMQVKLNDLREIKSWVLSFGALARVLHPPELVDMIRSDLQQLYQRYQ